MRERKGKEGERGGEEEWEGGRGQRETKRVRESKRVRVRERERERERRGRIHKMITTFSEMEKSFMFLGFRVRLYLVLFLGLNLIANCLVE